MTLADEIWSEISPEHAWLRDYNYETISNCSSRRVGSIGQRIKFCCHVLAPVAPRHSIQCLFSLLPFCPSMFPRLHDSAQKVFQVAPRVGVSTSILFKVSLRQCRFWPSNQHSRVKVNSRGFLSWKISWARALNSCVWKLTFIVLILTLMLSTLMSTWAKSAAPLQHFWHGAKSVFIGAKKSSKILRFWALWQIGNFSF